MRAILLLAVLGLAAASVLPTAEAARCSWRPAPGFEFECEGRYCMPGVGVTPTGHPFAGCAAWD